jgi:formylglycine-generating enzyme required for sulfatase activity
MRARTQPRVMMLAGAALSAALWLPAGTLFPQASSGLFIRGDVDIDGSVELSDAIALLSGLFGGARLRCRDAADVNDDGLLDITDPIHLLNFLFLGGRRPAQPYPVCGYDRTPDTLDCLESSCELPGVIKTPVDLTLVYIPPGSFWMGSPPSERGRDADENLHRVVLTCGFYMSRTEVTQGAFEHVMGYNPSYHRRNPPVDNGLLPVEMVTWDEAMEFCRRLSLAEGVTHRLPTEAEWEYACRAGTQGRFWFGEALECEDYCTRCAAMQGYEYGCSTWFDTRPFPVGSRRANGFGLYDMHGNVVEWCLDWYAPYPRNQAVVDPRGPERGEKKVARGVAWLSLAHGRSANREKAFQTNRGANVGFRIVRPVCSPLDVSPTRR